MMNDKNLSNPGEVLRPLIPIIELENHTLDVNKHPIVVISQYYDNNIVFHMTSNTDDTSIYRNVCDYRIIPRQNIQYNEQWVSDITFIRTDLVHEILQEDVFKCKRFYAFLKPNGEDTIRDLIANAYFVYDFLKYYNAREYDQRLEDLKQYHFGSGYNDLCQNRRYTDITRLLLDEDNFFGFITDINKNFEQYIDPFEAFEVFLQDTKSKYSGEYQEEYYSQGHGKAA